MNDTALQAAGTTALLLAVFAVYADHFVITYLSIGTVQFVAFAAAFVLFMVVAVRKVLRRRSGGTAK